MRWPVDRRPTRLTTLAAYETETAKVGVVAWKLYVEHKVKPPVQFYETKPHANKESALNRALAIYRNPGWGLKVLYIEQANGMRM